MEMRISNQDKKDLERYIKSFTNKAVQIIVQSRLGEKISTPCRPHAKDWFNLNISDLPEVLEETKKALNGEILYARWPLCVEISLRTADGDHMVLETWSLGVKHVNDDDELSINSVQSVYHRMATQLKTLLSTTRSIPAYKLSRRQGPDSYIICYRVYMEEPQTYNLGEGFKVFNFGEICTPVGTVQMSVSYRTKMTISPTHSGRDNTIMVKSDHFNTNNANKDDNNKENDDNNMSFATMKIGAFADRKKFEDIESKMIIPILPFSKLSINKKPSPDLHSSTKTLENNDDLNDSKTTIDDEVPVDEVEENQQKDENKNAEQGSASVDSKSALTMLSTNDDFIMKTPFATTNPRSELGKFYQEWQAAPPLQTFVDLPPLEETDVIKQLETFELEVNEYDKVVQSLCQSPNNN